MMDDRHLPSSAGLHPPPAERDGASPTHLYRSFVGGGASNSNYDPINAHTSTNSGPNAFPSPMSGYAAPYNGRMQPTGGDASAQTAENSAVSLRHQSSASRLMPSSLYADGPASNTSGTSGRPNSLAAGSYARWSPSPSPAFPASTISPSPSPTPSGRGGGAGLAGSAGANSRYAPSSAYSPPSTAGSVTSGALPSSASPPASSHHSMAAFKSFGGGASSAASPFAHSPSLNGSANLPRQSHTGSASGGEHSRHSSGYASSAGGAALPANPLIAVAAAAAASGRANSMSSAGSGTGRLGGGGGGGTANAGQGGTSAIPSLNALASTLARANLTDAQAIQMVASSSHGSSGGHSAYSLNALDIGQHQQNTRPPIVRQSFSDGLPFGLGNSSSTSIASTGSPANGHQLRHDSAGSGGGAGPNLGVPVSLPTTGPLSASDPRTQLYVSNLPYRVRWQDLKDLFRRAGTVLRADVSLTHDNRSRGFGTVLLATEDDARRACDMFKGFNWQGRTLDVKIDRSGTLLGIGVGQLNPTGGGATGVLSPAAGMQGGGMPSPLAGMPYAGQPQALGTSPNPRSAALSQQTPYGSSLPSGISPALLPFLGSSSRASIPSSMANFGESTQQAAWPSSQAGGTLSQPRSASLSAGVSPSATLFGTGGTASPFAPATNGQPSPFAPARLNQPQPSMHAPQSVSPTPSHASYAGNTSLPPPPMSGLPHNGTYMGRVLFVGNLPFHCQWQDLKDLFRTAGSIQRADVALTAEGKSRGFGTVLFAAPEDAQNAVRIYHGYEYSGRTLKVHFDRFAQASAPQSGALPGSPSQYTGAFAAANTPTPAANNIPPPIQQQQQHMFRQQQQQQQYGQQFQQPSPMLFSQSRGNVYQPQQSIQQPYYSSQGQEMYMQPPQQTLGIDHGSAFPSAFGLSGAQLGFQSGGSGSFMHQTGFQQGGPHDGFNAFGTTDPRRQSFSSLGAESQDDVRSQKSEASAPQEEEQQTTNKGLQTVSSIPAAPPTNRQTSSSRMGAAPGRITLPPQPFSMQAQPQQQQQPGVMAPYSPMQTRMNVPMTPGMPGFTFHPIPDTPPVGLHHLLSPGLGGPFSPPLVTSPYGGPATPGASSRAFNPMINPAPGAPIHLSNGVTTPMASMISAAAHHPGYNPMFPPIGMSYASAPQQQQSHLPQTPHWSQPRPPQQQYGSQQLDYGAQRRGSRASVSNNSGRLSAATKKEEAQAAAVGKEEVAEVSTPSDNEAGHGSASAADDQLDPNAPEEGYPFPLVQPFSSVLLQRRASTNSPAASPMAPGPSGGAPPQSPGWERRGSMHTGTVCGAAVGQAPASAGLGLHDLQSSTAEELARKIAQMSAHKALQQQQRGTISTGAGKTHADDGTAAEGHPLRTSATVDDDLTGPDNGEAHGPSALAGSALDDDESSAGGSAASGL